MRPFLCSPVFLIIFLLLGSCSNSSLDVDVSDIEEEVVLERFDQDLFEISQDSVNEAIDRLYLEYGDFFDIFNVHIIQIGQASSRLYPGYLSMFINDPTNREVYTYSSGVFSDSKEVNRALSSGFKHYLYHYPDSIPPRVIGYVSRFNEALFTVGTFVGVGLDQYLGADCPYYQQLGVPEYLLRKKETSRVAPDVLLAWATSIYPYDDSRDNLLSRMIWHGQLAWFVSAMFPEMDEQSIMGFTTEQMEWCRNNEKQMWTHLVEKKLLFSTNPLDIRKLVEDAPHTSFFTPESPGRAAVWQGMQIVKAYWQRNSKPGVPELMAFHDYQELLRLSAYNP